MLNEKLKSGKEIDFPAFFVNPQHKMDAEILSVYKERYNQSMKNIRGVSVSIKNSEIIFNELLKPRLSNFIPGITNDPPWIKIIDPDLNLLFSGTQNDKNEMIETGLFPEELYSIYEKTSAMSKNVEKAKYLMDNAYPLLDITTIRRLLRYQLSNQVDYILSPSVPITSNNRDIFPRQINKALDMNRISRSLYDTVLKGSQINTNYMSMLTLNMNVLSPNTIDDLVSIVVTYPSDSIGIKLLNFTEDKIIKLKHFLSLITSIKKIFNSEKPIYIFNVTEFGYICYSYGASGIVSPLATDPYFRRSISTITPPRRGAYQHPIDLMPYPYDDLLDTSRSMNYVFPCHCEMCQQYKTITKVNEKFWNRFRRIHFLLVKNMEIQEFIDAGNNLKSAIQDKFARSKRTAWLPFLT